MALAIDITDVTVKEQQDNAVSAVHFTVKPFNQLYITNNMDFKSAHHEADQARLNISAKGFWNTSHELAFLI